MKKFGALLLAGLLAVSATGCGGGTSGISDDGGYGYYWKFATAETEDYYQTVLFQKYLDMVSERTDGKVTGDVFPNGALGSMTEMYDGLATGTITGALDCLSALGTVSDTQDLWGLPYLYDSKEHQYNFWDNNFQTISDMIAEDCGIRIVCIMDGMNRNLTSNKPVNSLADLKGLKIRTPPIPAYIRTWELFGAAPIAMNFGEVYTNLQTGVINGQENDIDLNLKSKFYEVAPYWVMTEHTPYEGIISFDEATFQSYPKELQDIMLEVGAEIYKESREMISEMEADCYKQIEELDIHVMKPDLTEFKEAVANIRSEYPNCQKYLDVIEAAKVE